ncbi:hypothetical protein AH074_002228 [Salmonella enterica subsp. houtenae]|nr:hypothetical protein [Salmonella enterica subsp. houtenae]EGI6181462.1 hypothetical protein [Salmonella enterica subsp. houtenae serovar 51:z4,z23:-]EHD0026612.1 hypothetical protein [Salmonella enterica subsp. houtenae serovar 50:g,z51:-]ENZ86842.1 hypothetical protein D088_840018 [Salmonella enterica subsp. houtenae serovar 16:z4,z32:-- str. RKS3027]HBZ9863615.1 hypothetical protein [Salmonella enterica subsp. houtenae]
MWRQQPIAVWSKFPCRPRVLSPEVATEWMRQDIDGREAEGIAVNGAVPVDKFI